MNTLSKHRIQVNLLAFLHVLSAAAFLAVHALFIHLTQDISGTDHGTAVELGMAIFLIATFLLPFVAVFGRSLVASIFTFVALYVWFGALWYKLTPPPTVQIIITLVVMTALNIVSTRLLQHRVRHAESFKHTSAAARKTEPSPIALKAGQPLVYAEQIAAIRTPDYRFHAKHADRAFDSIHGMDEVKARIKKAAVEIVNPKLTPDGRIKQRNGILLFGEPGNGKTALVEALAGELDLRYITVTYGDVASKWINETTENVVRAFRDAAAQAPCLLFLDEIDSLISDRDVSSGYMESSQTTNSILTELINIRGKGVVVVGATNYLDKLDGAAIREGRFDYKIEITPPDEAARQGIIHDGLRWHLTDVAFDSGSVSSVARRWDGYSVKRIQAVTEELAEMHKESSIERVTVREFLTALRRIQGRKGRIPATTKSLDELILPAGLRQQLKSIATRMKDIERVERMRGTVPSGLLFFGAPGTGKTETARSLAKETEWAFLATTGNDLINDLARMDKLLAEAKDIRPCIVFIDEADDILANRKMSAVASVTNKLLSAMDGAGGKVPDVVFIAATNHPDHMDPAALRAGRFTEKLFFQVPDASGMREFVINWLKNANIVFEREKDLSHVLAIIGSGATIATAAAILQEAVNIMIGRTADNEDAEPVIFVEDFVAARANIKGGPFTPL